MSTDGYYQNSANQLNLAGEINYTQGYVQNDFLKPEYLLSKSMTYFLHTMVVKIPANSSLKQTYILDVPTGEEYDKMLDAIGYAHRYRYNNYEMSTPYSVARIRDGNGNGYAIDYATIEHKFEPRYYLQTGVLAVNSLYDYEDGKAYINSYNSDTHYFPEISELHKEDSVVTFYDYIFNDSFEDLDLSKVIFIHQPRGM